MLSAVRDQHVFMLSERVLSIVFAIILRGTIIFFFGMRTFGLGEF